jgi:hypothetical protein
MIRNHSYACSNEALIKPQGIRARLEPDLDRDEDFRDLVPLTPPAPLPLSAALRVFVCRSEEVQIIRNHSNACSSEALIKPQGIRARLEPDLDRDEDFRDLVPSTPNPSLSLSAYHAAFSVHSAGGNNVKHHVIAGGEEKKQTCHCSLSDTCFLSRSVA